MPLQSGLRLGAYEIVSPLGAGGMGEVYRARDTKLGRDVAIKVLPDVFVSDAARAARFQREAQLLAALNHPHIAAVYGLEQYEGTRLLAMELVDGESLAERIAAGAVPVDEALAIARQIGDALAAAHDKGIIHRDLKPANVMLNADGQVKVLDFGLAKMLERDPSESSASLSPTLSVHATFAGMILGTAAYMSPEQARGKAVDKRSDIWAFGCVLFEMLAGKRPFEGEDITDTIAAVVRGEPDWTALPTLPANVRAVVTGCLVKDRKQRFSDISVPLFLISEGAGLVSPAPAAPPVAPAAPFWRRVLPAIAVAIFAAAVTAAVLWSLRPAPVAPIVTRFSIPLAEGQRFSNTGRRFVGISRDGSQIIFNANLRLWLRALTELEARPLPGTDGVTGGVTSPTFSPDGRSVVFFSNPGALKKIATTGGVAVTLCQVDNPLGLDWQGDSILVGQGSKGILRVPASGGQPEVLVTVKAGELAHGPQLLPGGDRLLFTVGSGVPRPEAWDNAQIVVQSLKTGERKTIVQNGSDGRYLPTGHLVYATGGVAFAIRFDLDRLAVIGGPVPIIEGVARSAGGQTGAAQFSVADNGSLVYVAGPLSTSSIGNGVGLLDRDGRMEVLKLPEAPYEYPRISPDGKRIAVGTDDGKAANIWIYDVSGTTSRRQLTFGGRNRVPVWTADGERVAFQSDREGDAAIFWQRADGSGTAERITKPETGVSHVPQSWAPDGKRFLFTSAKGNDSTLWVYSLADKQSVRFSDAAALGSALTAAFSPDGKWVAYVGSVTAGVFVEPFPATGARFQVGAGIHPFWSPDGTELFVVPRGRFQSIKITTRPTFEFAPPVDLPRGRFIEQGPTFERNMDAMPDGKRFVATIPAGVAETTGSGTPQIQVVERWFDELKARVK